MVFVHPSSLMNRACEHCTRCSSAPDNSAQGQEAAACYGWRLSRRLHYPRLHGFGWRGTSVAGVLRMCKYRLREQKSMQRAAGAEAGHTWASHKREVLHKSGGAVGKSNLDLVWRMVLHTGSRAQEWRGLDGADLLPIIQAEWNGEKTVQCGCHQCSRGVKWGGVLEVKPAHRADAVHTCYRQAL